MGVVVEEVVCFVFGVGVLEEVGGEFKWFGVVWWRQG